MAKCKALPGLAAKGLNPSQSVPYDHNARSSQTDRRTHGQTDEHHGNGATIRCNEHIARYTRYWRVFSCVEIRPCTMYIALVWACVWGALPAQSVQVHFMTNPC